MIHDERAIELLLDLCRIPSVSTDESAAVRFMVEQATVAGMHAFVDDAGNFIAERGTGDRVIVLLGHIDTVDGFISPRIDDGVLYGRGAVDAKGPLATFLAAASRVVSVEGARIVVIGAVEEEAPTSKGAHFVVDRYSPAVAVIGEPSGVSAITLGYKGRISLRLRGARAHAHSAAAARSIASAAVNFWAKTELYCERFNDEQSIFARIDPHLSSFNTVTDGFEDRVDLRGSFRLPIDFSVDDLEGSLNDYAGEWGTCELHDFTPAFRSDKRNVLVRAFLTAIRAQDLEPRFTLKTGTSDMNVVGPAWGCPIVAYGPGDSHLDHAPNEHVSVDEYRRAIAILTRVLKRLVGAR